MRSVLLAATAEQDFAIAARSVLQPGGAQVL